jgi:hypothetical protein
VFGFTPRLPIDTSLEGIALPAVEDWVSARCSIQLQVQSSLKDAQARMEGVANPARRQLSFAVGERAWLSTAHLPLRLGTRKLAAKFVGPFPVLATVGEQAYKLALPASWQVHPVFHVSQLKEVSGNP